MTETHGDLQRRLLGKLVGGRYRAQEPIGTGGMGVVLGASDTARDGAKVALKALLPELMAGEAGTRFLRESELARSIRHPHVVATLDSGHDQEHGIHYLVMPLLQGRDLAAALGQLGALDPVAAVRIALQAARGINAAHRLGIIHRDIKPANLFLHEDAHGEIVVRVCDFGIAKQLGGTGELTATGSNLGTPDYASPEQLRNAKHVDERTDVWSLGATLYEMLCGVAPFSHIESVFDLVSAILTDDVPHIQDRAPWIEPGLAVTVHRALSREPDRRQATLEELADDLRPYSGGDELLTPAHIVAVAPERRQRSQPRADLSADSQVPEAPRSSQPDDLGLLGRTLSRKYRVIRMIGKGGMGAVYEVEAEDKRRLAAKVVPVGAHSAASSVLPRFAREAKAASAIESPHVVATYDAGTDEELGFPYIIMELLDGVDLSSLVKREGPLEPAVAARLVVQAARGVAAAHAVGVVHRDIKPANLFLHVDSESGAVTVKVCDFGVAKRTRSDLWGASHFNLTRSGGMLGSPMYMSPEQAKNAKAVDERTDVWSLAVVLWEALSGRRLWADQTSLGELIVAICTEPIPRIEAVAPWLPLDLARVVHHGLEREQRDRPQTVRDFIAELERFTGGTDRVTRDQLVGMSEERQRELAARSDSAEALSTGTRTGDQPVARASASGPEPKHPEPAAKGKARKRKKRRSQAARDVIGLVVVALVSGGLAAAVAYHGMSSALESEDDSSAQRAELIVEPAAARVSIDGQSIPVEDGRVTLTGKPGARFRVLVEHEGRQKTTEVRLDDSGMPEPRQVGLK